MLYSVKSVLMQWLDPSFHSLPELNLNLKQVKPPTSCCRFIRPLWGETARDGVSWSYFLFIFVFSIRRLAVELPRRPGAVKKKRQEFCKTSPLTALAQVKSRRMGEAGRGTDEHKAGRTMMRWCRRESNKEAAAGSRFELSHWNFKRTNWHGTAFKC